MIVRAETSATSSPVAAGFPAKAKDRPELPPTSQERRHDSPFNLLATTAPVTTGAVVVMPVLRVNWPLYLYKEQNSEK